MTPKQGESVAKSGLLMGSGPSRNDRFRSYRRRSVAMRQRNEETLHILLCNFRLQCLIKIKKQPHITSKHSTLDFVTSYRQLVVPGRNVVWLQSTLGRKLKIASSVKNDEDNGCHQHHSCCPQSSLNVWGKVISGQLLEGKYVATCRCDEDCYSQQQNKVSRSVAHFIPPDHCYASQRYGK